MNQTGYHLEYVGHKSTVKNPAMAAGRFAALFLCCLLSVMGMPRTITSAFGIDVNFPLLYTIQACLCLTVSLACCLRRPRRYLYPACLLLYAVWWFARSREILSSLYPAVDKIIPFMNDYMDWNLALVSPPPSGAATGNLEGLAFVSAFLCLFLCVVVFGVKSFLLSLVLPVLFLFFPYLFGQVPDLNSTAMILLGVTGFYTMLPGRKLRKPRAGRYPTDIPADALPALIVLVMIVTAAAAGSVTLKPVIKAKYRDSQTLQADVEVFLDNPLFFFQKAGVSEGNLRGGRFIGGSDTALILTADEPPDIPLYMQGFIGVSYDGKSWAKSDGAKFQAAVEDENTDTAALKLRSSTFENMLSWEGYAQNLHVTNISANPRYKYVPYGVKCSTDDSFAADTYIRAPDSKEYDLTYVPFMEASKYHINGGSFSYGAVSPPYGYDRFAEQEYLNVPEQTRNAFSQVEEGYSPPEESGYSSYEEYVAGMLSQNTSYSVTPGRTPAGRDYAAYFYFDYRKGYCMHYATTAALLLRMHGIPARFVSGYIVRPEQFKLQQDGRYKAVITEDSSHAWAELYRQGIGWIPLETTPGYGGSSLGAAGNDSKDSGTDPSAENQRSDREEDRETQEEASESQEDVGSAAKDGGGTASGGPLRLTHRSLAVLFIIIVSGLALAAFTLAALRKKRRRAQGLNEKVLAHFRRLCRRLASSGLKEDNDFDEEKIAALITECYPDIAPEDAARLIEIVEKAAFGPDEISMEEYEFVMGTGYF